jgi:hypothetical protein
MLQALHLLYPSLDLYEVASCNLVAAIFLTCFCMLFFGRHKILNSHDRFNVSGNMILDSHGRFNAYLCHVLNINLRITCDRFEGYLSLDFCFVWGGGSILSPDICFQLCILSKSFVIFLCSSHAALQIQADLYKDCRYSEDTNHWVCGSHHSV